MNVFSDSAIRQILGGAFFLAKQGIEWREDKWESVKEDPQTHADLSLLYGLVAA